MTSILATQPPLPQVPSTPHVLRTWADQIGLWCKTDNTYVLADALDTKIQEKFYNQLTLLGKTLAYVEGLSALYQLKQPIQIAWPWAKAAGTYYAISSLYHALKKRDINLPSLPKVDTIDLVPSVGTISAMVLNKTLFANAGSCEKNPIGLFAQEFVDSYRLAYSLGTEHLSRTWDAARGVRHKITLPVKPAGEPLANQLELEILPLLICANNAEACYNLKLKYPRGILIAQQSHSRNRDIALGLAGSLKDWALEHGNPQGWNTYEVHASELLSSKPIDKVIATLNTYDNTVLIIHDIEWLYTQTDKSVEDASRRAAIIHALKKLMCDDSRSSIVVVLTTTQTDHELAHVVADASLWYPGKLLYWPIADPA